MYWFTGSGLLQMYTLEILVCDTETGAPSSGWNPLPPSHTAPTGGGEPLDGSSNPVAGTNPTNPNPVEGAQGQLGGTPTLPLLGGGPNNPCEKVVTENAAAKSFLSRTKTNAHLTTIKQGINAATIEKGFSFGDGNGTEQVSDIKVGTDGVSVAMVTSSSAYTVKGCVHTHPIKGYFAPSAGDVYLLLEANSENPAFKYYFTISPNDNEYVMTIANKTAFDNFLTQYPKATYMTQTAAWVEDSIIGIEFEKVNRQFLDMGKTDDQAFELATAFVLNKYNTGIALSKKNASGDFKPIFVKEETVTIPNPVNISYPPIQIVHYSPTDNCNLK